LQKRLGSRSPILTFLADVLAAFLAMYFSPRAT
jgi:hypothetical protein